MRFLRIRMLGTSALLSREMVSNTMMTGMKIFVKCVSGNQHRVSHPVNSKVSRRTLDLVHVDLCEMDFRFLGGGGGQVLFYFQG